MTWMTISKFGGFPLGVLQVFAPIRMGNVPDCSQSHRSLRCLPSASPPEEGKQNPGNCSTGSRSTFRHPLVPGGAVPEMLVSGGSLSSAPQPLVRPATSQGERSRRAR